MRMKLIFRVYVCEVTIERIPHPSTKPRSFMVKIVIITKSMGGKLAVVNYEILFWFSYF